MDTIEAIILGILQGLTEFIPVSSSGHLVIGQYFFNGSSDHLFLEWVNIGTFLALLIYFRRRIIAIARDVVIYRQYRMALNIFITAVPAGLIGFFGGDFIASTHFFNSIVTVICALVLVGVLMIVLDRLPKTSTVDDGGELPPPRALTVGMIQILALIPGVSRSGSTIIAGRLMGLPGAKAAEYSFLVSLPIMLGVTLKLILGSDERAYFFAHLEPVILGNIAAFISGILAVGFLMRYLSAHSLAVFGWYRIGLASVVTLILLIQ